VSRIYCLVHSRCFCYLSFVQARPPA
jgi:hypothetical protein